MAELIPIANLRGPQGIQGPSGAGWDSKPIGDVHLDTILTPGTYRQPTNGFAVRGQGYPISNTGVLEVIIQSAATDPPRIQRYTPVWGSSSARGFFQRAFTSQWTAWYFVPSQRIDNTAGRAIYTWDETAGREQLIYGDTGLRMLPLNPDLAMETQSGENAIYLRRQMHQVHIQFRVDIKTVANGAGTDLVQAGMNYMGFRALRAATGTCTLQSPSGTITPVVGQWGTVGGLRIWWTVTTGGIVAGTIAAITQDPWPTTLPGTAVGSIPTN